MNRAPLLSACSYAWLGTLATAVIVGLAFGVAAFAPVLMFWLFPMTIVGLVTWPLTKRVLMRTTSMGWRSPVLRVLYGVLIGAGAAAFFAALFFALPFAIVSFGINGWGWGIYVDFLPFVILGATTGLIWAIWFLALAQVMGVDRPEPS